MKPNEKIIFIGDVHLNEWSLFAKPVKFNNMFFNSRLLEQLNVLEQILIFVAMNNYKVVVLLGDVFHRFTIQTFFVFDFFLKKLAEIADEIYLLAGNHDYIDETKNLTYFDYFNYEKLKVIKDLEIINGIGFLPFIRDEEIGNYKLKILLNKGIDTLIMHNNIEDMPIRQGIRTKGLSKQLLKRFKYVINGHYHDFGQFKTYEGHLFNVGAIMDTTFVDANSPQKGIFEFDFSSKTWKRYELKYKQFLILDAKELENLGEEVKKNSYIRIKVEAEDLESVKNFKNIEVLVKPKRKEYKVLTLEEALKQVASEYKDKDLAERFIFSLL